MKNNNFKIQLVKEVYQGKEFTLPYRQYVINYYDEEYHVTVDDKIYGNYGGEYSVDIFFIRSNINREKKKIYNYAYAYDKDKVDEKIDSNYKDIVLGLMEEGIIKKIQINKKNKI